MGLLVTIYKHKDKSDRVDVSNVSNVDYDSLDELWTAQGLHGLCDFLKLINLSYEQPVIAKLDLIKKCLMEYKTNLDVYYQEEIDNYEYEDDEDYLEQMRNRREKIEELWALQYFLNKSRSLLDKSDSEDYVIWDFNY